MRIIPFPSFRRQTAVWLLGLMAAGLLGCGSRPRPVQLHPVHGKVVVGDKVVKEGTVQLRADQSRGNTTGEHPSGAIQDDGTFEIETNGKPGAPPGWYKVLVMADNFKVVDPPPSPVWPNYPEGFLPKPLVNDRYLYFNQTDVTIEVLETPPEGGYVLRLKP